MTEKGEVRQIARTLTNAQREAAIEILRYVGSEVERIAGGDEDLAFRLRRYIHARVQMDNSGTSQQRQKRQKKLFDKQAGRCALCEGAFVELAGTEMHRLTPGRYTETNTVLVHRECHQEHHRRDGTAPDDSGVVPRGQGASNALGTVLSTSPNAPRVPQYFLTPASDRGQVSAAEAVRRQLTDGWYSWGANTPGVRSLRPGDRICFYATRNVGVVAEAEAASEAEHSGGAGDPFPMRFRVNKEKNCFIDPPIAIDADLRSKLEWFVGRDPYGPGWRDFVRSTRTVSERDFELLTGKT